MEILGIIFTVLFLLLLLAAILIPQLQRNQKNEDS